MTMLYWLCCRAKKNDSMSRAAIYRSVESERPTLLLDETSWVVDQKDDRQGILCGGFERNGFVENCEGDSANITVRRYSTYCPKAFGIIGKLTATLMDRSIEIPMQRKKNERVERLRRPDDKQHAELRRKCLRWANDNRKALASIEPKLPDGLNDRAIDIWEPLLAVAQQIGGDWPKLADQAAKALSGGEAATEERSVELLADIKRISESSKSTEMTTKALIVALCDDEERPWATYNKGNPITDRQLAKLLEPFHVLSETIHAKPGSGGKDAKGYKFDKFRDAFERYLTPADDGQNDASAQIGGLQASERPNADEIGITNDFSIRPESDPDGCEKCEKPASHRQKDSRTDKNPQTDDEACSGHPAGGNGTGGFRSDVEDAFEDIPPSLDRRTQAVCAQCGAGGPGDLPTVAVTAQDGTTVYVHEHGCFRFWKKENGTGVRS
jgi:hypothetical protein